MVDFRISLKTIPRVLGNRFSIEKDTAKSGLCAGKTSRIGQENKRSGWSGAKMDESDSIITTVLGT